MRKLDRTCVPTPPCLGNYDHTRHNWDDLGANDKVQIRQCLEQMQGRRCAYCEGSLDELGQHIEHFRRKSPAHFPHLTFTWSNLYWSCDQTDSCGHFKDHGAGAYAVAELIEPCVDDPDRYFRFRSFGTIDVRPGLSAAEQHRANETLRVFNLHPQWGRLRNMRRRAVAQYLNLVDQVDGFTAAELQDLFSNELEAAKSEPFSTAIRHVLTEP